MTIEPDDLPLDDDARTAWDLLHVRELLGAAASAIAAADAQLDGLDPETLTSGAGVAISAEEIEQVVGAALALQDLGDRAALLLERLAPRSEPLVLGTEAITPPAAATLASGSADRTLVLLAAKLLSAGDGFPALAAGLDADPSLPDFWEELTVGDLLGSFRDADATRTGRVCDEAGVDGATQWSALGRVAVGRVAIALRAVAGV